MKITLYFKDNSIFIARIALSMCSKISTFSVFIEPHWIHNSIYYVISAADLFYSIIQIKICLILKLVTQLNPIYKDGSFPKNPKFLKILWRLFRKFDVLKITIILKIHSKMFDNPKNWCCKIFNKYETQFYLKVSFVF